ncbi:MAG: flagellar basal body rod protein FlgC [candidate division Zixibacteria bacterium]|nr:flagellar basal body rod protein FlgC [candidate division Zixibacteria bacterium]
MSGILNAIGISSKGLSVQRAKMNVVAQNIANAETAETPEGGPYRRKRVTVQEEKVSDFKSLLRQADTHVARTHPNHRPGRQHILNEEVNSSSVAMTEIEDPESSFKLVYDPSHPEANEEGYVRMPDIEIINEMVDMMAATRAYEANTVAISSAKTMAKDALEI